MDACHILLVRPWLFDHRVIHDGYQNTYTVLKNGKDITLAPSVPRQITKPKTKAEPKRGEMLLYLFELTLLASHCEFKTLKEMILFTPLENETETPFHPVALQLLQEFSNVFPEETPFGQPPQRSIQLHINLIPKAILPNKLAYRMNSKDTMEIQRQVGELICRGLVSDSLRLCVVPTLFVPETDGCMRMCADSRAIHKITIKYRHLVPRLEDMLDELHGYRYFSGIDLRNGHY